MPDTGSNIIVQTVGNTANLATDFGTSGVNLADAHVPLQKIAYGNSGAAIRVSDTNPLPITVSGSDVAISVSGLVGPSGEFGIVNAGSKYLRVAGTSAGGGITVQGEVGITSLGLAVTGGIIAGLKSSRDTVKIQGGTLEIVGHNGITFPAAKIFAGGGGATGAAVGISGDAMKVAVVNAGFTAVVTLSSTVGVTNNGILKVGGDGNFETPVGATLQPININSIAQPSGFTNGQFDVISTVGRQLPAAPLGSGVKLRAISTNTATIYLGYTFNPLGTTNGYPLLAGESCYLEVNNLNLVNVVGGATGQLLAYIGS